MASSNRYPPGAESALITAVNTFHDVAATNPSLYATTSAAITSLGSKVSDFVSKYDICQVPSTRTKPAIEAKDASKELLLAYFRPLVRDVTNSTTMDNTKRAALGIPLRDTLLTPIQPPEDVPSAKITGMDGWTVSMQLRVAGSDRRAFPDGVKGAYLWSFAGPAAPADPSDWDFEGATTRSDCKVAFANTLTAGTKVWVCAQFFNPRQQTGPACAPIGLIIGGGVPESMVG